MQDINGIKIKEGNNVKYVVCIKHEQHTHIEEHVFPVVKHQDKLYLKNNNNVCVPIEFFRNNKIEIVS